MQRILLWLCVLLASTAARAAETIPAAPTRFFNDFALTVKPETAERLNHELADFERQTSTQIITAIFAKMESDSAVEVYAQHLYQAWKIGQKGSDNGVLIVVFIQDHKIWIQTGRGAEGALPDATCKDIVSDQIAPLFKKGDFDGGMVAGVESVMQALKGQYKGNGSTDYDRQNQGSGAGAGGFPWLIILIILAFVILPAIFNRRSRGVLFGPSGPSYLSGGFGGGSDFGDSGGGSSSGGGDFFSGGGGSSGGGGAGGSW